MVRKVKSYAGTLNASSNILAKWIFACLIFSACGYFYIFQRPLRSFTKIKQGQTIYSGETVLTKIDEGKNKIILFLCERRDFCRFCLKNLPQVMAKARTIAADI
jgi:hypothetical protein